MQSSARSSPFILCLATIVLVLVVGGLAAAQEVPEVGVEWINKCSPCGNGNLSHCDDDAVGFYNALGSAGAIKRWNWGDQWAWEQDFKYKNAPGGGTDYIYVDQVDIVMHVDHGGPGVFCFGEKNHDYCHFWCHNARWGDIDLEWIALDDCSCLYNGDSKVFQRWWDAFKGLHLILGFHTSCHDTGQRGPKFGAKLVHGWRVTSAWRYACEHTEGGGTRGAIMGVCGGETSSRDHLWGYGYVTPDVDNPTCEWWYSFSCD